MPSPFEKGRDASFDEDSDRALLAEDQDSKITSTQRRKTRYPRLLLPIAVVILALTNIASLLVLLRRKPYHQTGPIYPKLKGVDSAYRWIQFQATITKQSHYVARPSPEVDQAWEDLGVELDELLISTRYARAADISPDHVMVELEPGEPNYVVGVEAFHQIHCLNLLRKSLSYNVDYYRNLGPPSTQTMGIYCRRMSTIVSTC